MATGHHGRTAGSPNYKPSKPLEVRKECVFRLHADATVKAGLRHVQIYAADVEHSVLLETLSKAVKQMNPDLLKLLKKLGK